MNSCIKQKFDFVNLAIKNSNINSILIYSLTIIEMVDLILPLHFKVLGLQHLSAQEKLLLWDCFLSANFGDRRVDCIYLLLIMGMLLCSIL